MVQERIAPLGRSNMQCAVCKICYFVANIAVSVSESPLIDLYEQCLAGTEFYPSLWRSPGAWFT